MNPLRSSAPRPGRFRRPRRISVLALAAVFLPAVVTAAKWKEPSQAEKDLVEDASRGLVGAVYLEKILLSDSNKTFHVSVRAKILSKTGFPIGSVEHLPVTTDNIEGRTIGPTGKVTELSSKDVHRTAVLKSGGYSVDQLSFTMPALEPGCFIEYSYREWGWLGAAGAFHTEILFQDEYPILFQELRTPKAFPFSSTTRRQRGAMIEFGSDGSQYYYRVANAPALHDEPYGLPPNERAAGVIFAWVFSDVKAETADDYWREITKKGLVPMVDERLVRPGKVEAALKTIPGSRAADAEARLRAIYAYVQKNVKNRWVLRPGESEPKEGWKKNGDAGDTLAHGEGSPSDLAAVFLSLLRADGWHARVVFVPDREERFFHPEIPSMFQFGGWAVEVSDPGLSGPVCVAFDHPLLPFGMLPARSLGGAAWAVNLEARKGEKVDLPQWPGEKNGRRRAWSVSINEEGDVEVERVQHALGQQAFESRVWLYHHGRELVEKDLREGYQKLDPPGELESLEIQNGEDPEREYVVTTRFRRKGFAPSLPGGRIEISPLTMLQTTNPFTQDKREEPILFAYPYVDEEAMTITPPPGYAVDALPPAEEVKTMVGRYAVRAERAEGGTVTVARVFALSRFTAGPEFYGRYRTLFEGAARDDAAFVIVFKKSASAPKAGR